jgi:hypothetical protein
VLRHNALLDAARMRHRADEAAVAAEMAAQAAALVRAVEDEVLAADAGPSEP